MRSLALLLLPTLALAGEPLRLVRGHVLGEDGEPVPGATISLEDELVVAESAPDGSFAFELAGEEAAMRVVAPGYASAWFQGRVRREEPFLGLRVRRGASLAVRVVDGTGRAIAGATVGLFPAPRVVFLGFPTHLRLDRTAVTGPDGRCELTGLLERHYEVAVVAAGKGGATASALCGTPELRLSLHGQRISNRRFVYEGLPGQGGPPGVELGPAPPDPEPPEPPPAAEAPPPEEEPAPEPAQEEEQDPKTAVVSLRVVSADGIPVPDAHVSLSWRGAGGRGLSEGSAGPDFDGFEFAGEDGRASLVLVPGRYRMEVGPRFDGAR